MLINEFVVNDQQINGDLSYVDGLLITIGKDVTSRESQSTTTLITVEKTIAASLTTTTLLRFGKAIDAEVSNSFYSRNGWEPIIVIGNKSLRYIDLTGGITVTKSEGDNTTAEFTIILYPNTYDLYTYQGKSVAIHVRTAAGIRRIFTGKVDVPVVNVFEEKLTLQCVADRRVLLNNLSGIESSIGYYSETVLGTSDEVVDRINSRMSTIPSSLDFDSSNNYSITSWTPKASPDFSYGSSSVFRRNPQLTIDSSGQIINKTTITLEYGYQRHHARYATYVWQHPYNPTDYQTGEGGICPFLTDSPSMPTKQMILSAIDSAGWPIVPQTSFFGRIFRSGSYQCNGFWVQWSTTHYNFAQEPVLDAEGHPVKDNNGNNITRTILTGVEDYADVYTMFAQWIASTQFNQNVKERYTITVQAPESVSRYGALPTQDSYGYTAIESAAFANWEEAKAYSDPPAGVTRVVDPISGSYWFNGNFDRNVFNAAYVTAIRKAQTAILKTHRTTRINFQRPLTPTIELKHTVSLTGKWIRGKGKCNRITHYLNISDNSGGVGGEAYTDVTLLQYRGTTTVTNTPLVPTTPPADTYIPTQWGAILQTHLGEDPSGPNTQYWNGYVGNKAIDVFENGYVNHTKTFYQESFIVDTPAIPGEIRNDRTLFATANYNVNIPNDDIEYQSYG